MGNCNKTPSDSLNYEVDETERNSKKKMVRFGVVSWARSRNVFFPFNCGFKRHRLSSTFKPLSKVSRRRWKDDSRTSLREAAKTVWPVSVREALFLPEFKINGSIRDNFEIVDVIGEGTFGNVIKVVEKTSGETFAIKIIHKEKIVDNVSQLKDEVSIQYVCKAKPFLVGCLHYWQTKLNIYIVSEFAGGGSLYKFCSAYAPLAEPLAKLYLAELLCALDFLHYCAGVIHRDIKLENILLDLGGHCKITDFGFAKWLRYGEKTTGICGTLGYMAPEVVGPAPYGHSVDYYSLGVIACVLIIGEFPEDAVYQTTDGNEVVHAVSENAGNLPSGCDCSEPARYLLKSLLQKDSHRRLRTIAVAQTLPFFRDIKFSDVRRKLIKPCDILPDFFSKLMLCKT